MKFKLYDYQIPVKDKLVKKLKKHGTAMLMAEESVLAKALPCSKRWKSWE